MQFVFDTNAGGFCAGDGWTMLGAFGGVGALRQGDPTLHGFSSQDANRLINLKCAMRSLIAGVTDFNARRAAVLLFADPWSEGRVVWERPVERAGNSGVGISRIRASDQLLAFEFVSNIRQMYVGGPRGERLAVDDAVSEMLAGRSIESIVVDGPHLVMEVGSDIYLYTRRPDGTGTLENLTPLRSAQYDPWVSGRYIVWIDQRHGVVGDVGQTADTEVYLYDIETRTERRITHDPPERPVLQFDARVEGDWIVWLDQRISPDPGRSPEDAPEVPRAVYGYHIPTGREVPLVTGDHLVTGPMIANGELWYNCIGNLRTPEQFEGVYRMPMPQAPTP